MPAARYFLPDHRTFTEVYDREELRAFVQEGLLSRSDIVCDDETGLAHLLGDLLASPYPDATIAPLRRTTSFTERQPSENREFRASTPLGPSQHIDDPVDQLGLHVGDDLSAANTAEDDADADLDSAHTRQENERRQYSSGEHEDNLDPDEESEDEGHAWGGAYAPDQGARDDFSLEEDLAPEGEGNAPLLTEIVAPFTRGPEETLYMCHPSWFSYPRSLVGCILCTLLALYCWRTHVGLEWITLLSSVAGLFLLFISLDRTTTSYYITTRRVEMETGLVGRNTKEVRHCDIRAIDVQQQGFGALMGFGHVNFDSSASGGVEVRFRNVHSPHAIKDLVRQLQG